VRPVRLLGATLCLGLVAGVALDVLTFLVARFGPQGGDEAPWSFRGNGALIVPFGLGPACLAAAWSALVLHARGAEHWRTWSASAGTVGALIVLLSAGVLMVFGSVGQAASNWLSIVPLAWTLIAPAVVAVLPLACEQSAAQPPRLVYAIAGLLFPVALGAGFFGAELVVSPGT
jgi:hypothetical protein